MCCSLVKLLPSECTILFSAVGLFHLAHVQKAEDLPPEVEVPQISVSPNMIFIPRGDGIWSTLWVHEKLIKVVSSWICSECCLWKVTAQKWNSCLYRAGWQRFAFLRAFKLCQTWSWKQPSFEGREGSSYWGFFLCLMKLWLVLHWYL